LTQPGVISGRIASLHWHEIHAFHRPFRAWLAAGLVAVVVYDVASWLLMTER
jgi:transcriptional regulator GlxA family with amidase domain